MKETEEFRDKIDGVEATMRWEMHAMETRIMGAMDARFNAMEDRMDSRFGRMETMLMAALSARGIPMSGQETAAAEASAAT